MGDFFWNYGMKYGGDRHSIFFMHMPINAIEPLSIGYTFSVFSFTSKQALLII